MLTFQETLDYLYSRLPMYQRVGKIAYKNNLDNTIALLKGVGNPETKLKTVHIAGTNGKGSSAHALAAILQLAGYKTGLYTSPHLKRFTERIKINGKEISETAVVSFVHQYQGLLETIHPSFFEATVAMAFDYFARENVDIAVIETGLGGRLDSTNVILPEVCLITNIGFDHTDLLGDTIEKIAREKAGIIKPNVPVVIGDMVEEGIEVMKEVAQRQHAPLILTSRETLVEFASEIPYFGKNVPGVLAVVDELRAKGWTIPQQAVTEGLVQFAAITGLQGRFQRLQQHPLVVADVSHNPDGLRLLMQHVSRQEFTELRIIFASVQDKDLMPVFNELPQDAIYYWTQSHVPRRLAVSELAKQAMEAGLHGKMFENVNDAKKAALAEAAPDDLILITGSTFVVAELDDLI